MMRISVYRITPSGDRQPIRTRQDVRGAVDRYGQVAYPPCRCPRCARRAEQ